MDPISLAALASGFAMSALAKASWSLVAHIRKYFVVGRKGDSYKIRVEFENDKFVELDIEGDIDDLSLEELAKFLSELDINTAEDLEKLSDI